MVPKLPMVSILEYFRISEWFRFDYFERFESNSRLVMVENRPRGIARRLRTRIEFVTKSTTTLTSLENKWETIALEDWGVTQF